MLAKTSARLMGLSRAQYLLRTFAINKVINKRKDWYDETHAEKTRRPEYIVPEEKTARVKKAEEDFLVEDFKEKLLGARHFKIEPKVEEDLIFGTNLPNLLELSKLDAAEMFRNDQPVEFDYLLRL